MYFIVSIIIVAILAGVIFLYYKWNHSYWRRKGIPYLEPEFFWGNTRKQLREGLAFGDMYANFYSDAKSKGYRHLGVYALSRPTYIPVDIELVKNILQRDFSHFVNHGLYFNEEIEPLTGHIFNLENERWRNLRTKLTPTFTSGKMKMMFQTLVDCTSGLIEVLNDHSIVQDPVDIKEVISRFTTDVIGSCAFGIDCNSLKNPNSEFRTHGKKFFEPTFYEKVKTIASFMFPHKLLKFFNVRLTDKEVEKFFINMVRNTVEYREENNIFRKDFMHLLLQLKNQGELTDDEIINKKDTSSSAQNQSLTLNELAAQCFAFFSAGFETSATTMTFALLELALNQDIQEKLRQNIDSVLRKHNNQLTYEAVMEMTYLDKVVYETLRKHPPAPIVPRVCNKEYKIPGTDVTLDAGTRVNVSILAIHRDPEFYPNPEMFDPERFNEKNKAKRPAYSFLAFGEGPRICIGARFGLIQAKVGLIAIIKNFKVNLNERTQTPIKYENQSFIISVKGGVWLNASRIEEQAN